MNFKQVASKAYLHVTCFTLVTFLAYSSTLKVEVTCSSETSVDFQRTTRHRCENPKSYIFNIKFHKTSIDFRGCFCGQADRADVAILIGDLLQFSCWKHTRDLNENNVHIHIT
jgi:hypothetical protein